MTSSPGSSGGLQCNHSAAGKSRAKEKRKFLSYFPWPQRYESPGAEQWYIPLLCVGVKKNKDEPQVQQSTCTLLSFINSYSHLRKCNPTYSYKTFTKWVTTIKHTFSINFERVGHCLTSDRGQDVFVGQVSTRFTLKNSHCFGMFVTAVK